MNTVDLLKPFKTPQKKEDIATGVLSFSKQFCDNFENN